MKRLIITLFILGLLFFTFRFIIGGPEDDWICVKGQWVKHGNPATTRPTKVCDN